jgi:Fur family ferric uptake transcriptional regulator
MTEVLKKYGLKITPCRKAILSVCKERECALSEAEFKEKIGEGFDRTTFFRSFKTLVDKGILHKVVLDNSITKYALSKEGQNTMHAHFYCEQCHRVRCLSAIKGYAPVLPEGFHATAMEVIVKGLCDKCYKK